MNSFLQRIASRFYEEYRADIRKLSFVFPNRRAGLFFQKYLSEIVEKPLFSPEILTVNECFFNASDRLPADRTAELFRIYRIYKELSRTEESFDAFVFWGEMLLSDFDEVDKYRIDAEALFKNLSGIKEIDYLFDSLSEEQKEAIRLFWHHVVPESESETKKSFIAIWEVLYELYQKSRSELLSENRATEGMIFREIADRLEADDIPDYFEGKQFVFVGFNALNPTEEVLFSELRKRGQADFYWDYEADVLRDAENRASRFYKNNLRDFPSKLDIKPGEAGLEDLDIELIAVPSSVGQSKEIYRLLQKLYPEKTEEKEWIKTAVVLPDESLLLPMLHALPPQIENINVTMGFPLKATPVASLLENIFELQRRTNSKGQFYHITVSNILKHQYISKIFREEVQQLSKRMVENNAFYVENDFFAENELLSTIFTLRKQPNEFVAYLLEILQKLHYRWQQFSKESESARLEADFIFQYYTAINRMQEVMSDTALPDMNLETMIRLIRQLVSGISIPFEGEPLNGLQLIGMLETRGLDFENLIIASFNEGVFPKKQSINSFVPYNLRRAFGLPTDEYHDAISAYNFYRLIQRTKRIFFLYDSRTDGMQTGEVSRYLYQLHYQYRLPVRRVNLIYEVDLPQNESIVVEKNETVMQKLMEFTDQVEKPRALSPSSINTYINCPLSFYFSYVERMREQDEVTESVEAAMFGTIVHHVLENLYKEMEGQLMQKHQLEELAKNKFLLEKAIKEAFSVEFFKKEKTADIELTGNHKLLANIIYDYIKKLVELDAERAPFTYIQSEKDLDFMLPVFKDKFKVRLYGKVDRVDEKEGVVRIVDYKTGGDDLSFKDIDELFDKDKDKRPKAVLQTFLYSELYMRDSGAGDILPEVVKTREIFDKDFSSRLRDKQAKHDVERYADYREEFMQRMQATVEELFNPEIPFTQAEEKHCVWCPYQSICRREVKANW